MKTSLFSGTSILLVLLHLCSGLTVVDRQQEDEGELIFASMLYRHGQRAPERPYPNDPYKDDSYWPFGFGMLDDKGKMQQFLLGQWLRLRYSALIPNGKYSHDLVYVRSTDWDRTLMSAESNLAGMFYPTQVERWNDLEWQPVPIHTVPRELDKLLAMEYPCPAYDAELEAVKRSPKMQKYAEDHKSLYDYLTEHTGEPTDDPIKVTWLYSNLYIETLNNYTLPNWTESVFPELMYPVAAFGFGQQTMSKTLKRLNGGPLLKEMISHMKEKKNGTLSPNRSLWVYSAHDTTVAGFLDTVGVFEPHTPPFAATVLVELRRNSNNQYLVSVHYKNTTGEPTLLTVPGCKQFCPLEQFESLLSYVIPSDWDAECQEAPEKAYV